MIMTPEAWTVIGTGIALAAIIITGFASLRNDVRELRERTTTLEAELRERTTKLEAELRERMARLEGLLDGLREAVTGRKVA